MIIPSCQPPGVMVAVLEDVVELNCDPPELKALTVMSA